MICDQACQTVRNFSSISTFYTAAGNRIVVRRVFRLQMKETRNALVPTSSDDIMRYGNRMKKGGIYRMIELKMALKQSWSMRDIDRRRRRDTHPELERC